MVDGERPDPENVLEQVAANQAANGATAPKEPETYVHNLLKSGGGGDFFSEEDKLQEAVLELFNIPGDMTDLETVKRLLIRSDLPEHQVKLVSRVLALSQIFEPSEASIEEFEDEEDEENSMNRELASSSHISVPRIIVSWYLLARIASERQGRKEYAAVLGYQLEREARANEDV